jgi:hypothetical protein
LKILHSTSDILGVAWNNGQLEITLYGDRHLAGEIVFEGEMINSIESAMLDGKIINLVRDEKRIAINYPHKQGEETILRVNLR